jgi:hypothetical protein
MRAHKGRRLSSITVVEDPSIQVSAGRWLSPDIPDVLPLSDSSGDF